MLIRVIMADDHDITIDIRRHPGPKVICTHDLFVSNLPVLSGIAESERCHIVLLTKWRICSASSNLCNKRHQHVVSSQENFGDKNYDADSRAYDDDDYSALVRYYISANNNASADLMYP